MLKLVNLQIWLRNVVKWENIALRNLKILYLLRTGKCTTFGPNVLILLILTCSSFLAVVMDFVFVA